jgi:hypothetical protein
MTNETCPHCGAEQDTLQPNLYYLCGSIKGMPEHRTLKCFKTQVAHQAAEIERLQADNKYLKVSLHKVELLVEHRRQSRG